ncbi:MAG: hypothetical protein IT288_08040 [Bdellovibrionales bacterium]|nr:hypothetical protein [Bdellovibrionales bacterium]
MTDIIELLFQKNCHLEKFFRLNEAELLNFSDGNFDNLETFYHSRESLLEMIQKIDKRIEDSNSVAVDQTVATDAEKKKILEAIAYKNELVTRILAQDLQILSIIEKAKSGIIKELSSVKVARKAMKGYHSGGGTSQLDEKA